MKFSFGIGSAAPLESNDGLTSDESSWPSSLIGKNISYEVPLKAKSTGINIREMIRKVTVKLAGKKVTGTIIEDQVEVNNSIRLLDNVNVQFRRGRMTCLMGTSGK